MYIILIYIIYTGMKTKREREREASKTECMQTEYWDDDERE